MPVKSIYFTIDDLQIDDSLVDHQSRFEAILTHPGLPDQPPSPWLCCHLATTTGVDIEVTCHQFYVDCKFIFGHIYIHYSDVMINAMASQITSLTIAYSTVYSSTDQRKHQNLHVTGLCEGNFPVTVELPTHKARNAERFPLMTSSCNLTLL